MKRTLILTVLLGLLLWGQSFGQNTANAILHVTSVRSEDAKDWCPTGGCSATKLTVEGYISAKSQPSLIEYVLECVEVVVSEPSPHFTVVCDKVHAHTEYLVKVGPDFIAFEHEKQPSTTATLSLYKIVSEKEVATRKAK